MQLTIDGSFQSLMCAHDAIAQKDFYPHLPDIPVEVDEDEETIKIVQLVKSNEPLVSPRFFIFIQVPTANNIKLDTNQQKSFSLSLKI